MKEEEVMALFREYLKFKKMLGSPVTSKTEGKRSMSEETRKKIAKKMAESWKKRKAKKA